MRNSTRFAAVLLSACLLPAVALPAAAVPARESGVPVVQPAFGTSMPARFGGDADADGLIDLPNTTRYVQNWGSAGCDGCGPARFRLRLDASASRASWQGSPVPIVDYRWRIAGPDGSLLTRRSAQPVIGVDLPEGTYRVTLDVSAALGWATATARVEREVVVEDFLIVALGDSYASGEGNPEVPRGAEGGEARWADSPDPDAEAAHAAAHRSSVSWPALAAVAWEEADAASSVTFVSLATTGAQVRRGILEGEQPGEPGQLALLADLIRARRIDALMISIGGNDIGFVQVVRGLVDADPQMDPVCYDIDISNVWESARDGVWSRGSTLRLGLPWGLGCRATEGSGSRSVAGLDGLPAELDALAGALSDLAVGEVYLMEYPDPTGWADGEAGCEEIAGDITSPFGFHEIDRGEQQAGWQMVLAPLNRTLAEAAAHHGWDWVDGVALAFADGHGYCGSEPAYARAGQAILPRLRFSLFPEDWYGDPRSSAGAELAVAPGVAWFRTAAQSKVLQGPDVLWETMGTLHPNELGQLRMAAAVLGAMQAGSA